MISGWPNLLGLALIAGAGVLLWVTFVVARRKDAKRHRDAQMIRWRHRDAQMIRWRWLRRILRVHSPSDHFNEVCWCLRRHR